MFSNLIETVVMDAFLPKRLRAPSLCCMTVTYKREYLSTKLNVAILQNIKYKLLQKIYLVRIGK